MREQLEQINALHLWDFELARPEEGVVRILGSNDFAYGHYLEAEFRGVTFCDAPERFAHAQFRLGGDGTVWIDAEAVLDADDRMRQIRATELEVRIGRVSYAAR